MILEIDTTKETALIRLLSKTDQKIIDQDSISTPQTLSEQLLTAIDALLIKNHSKLKDLNYIVVNSGPGSYTGTRIGVTTANLLAYSLNIPIFSSGNSKQKTRLVHNEFVSPVIPIYNSSPHITKSKAGR